MGAGGGAEEGLTRKHGGTIQGYIPGVTRNELEGASVLILSDWHALAQPFVAMPSHSPRWWSL